VEHTFLQPSGDVLTLNVHPAVWGMLWKRQGLDEDGVPVYRPEDCLEIAKGREGLISPYNFRSDVTRGLACASIDDRGVLTALVTLRSAPGPAGRAGGTDVIALGAEGDLRWLHPLAQRGGLVGLSTVGPITFTEVDSTGEVIALSRDGLGLGSFGPAARERSGVSLRDGPHAVRAFRGRDGLVYVLIADEMGGMHHWWRVRGVDAIVTSAAPVILSETPKAVAALPPP
jgi:hypothetical protein